MQKTKRSTQKIGWAWSERWPDIPVNAWARAEREAGGRWAETGCHKNRFERWAANRPLTLCSHVLAILSRETLKTLSLLTDAVINEALWMCAAVGTPALSPASTAQRCQAPIAVVDSLLQGPKWRNLLNLNPVCWGPHVRFNEGTRTEMLAVHLVKTHYLPSLLYGCETWHLNNAELIYRYHLEQCFS